MDPAIAAGALQRVLDAQARLANEPFDLYAPHLAASVPPPPMPDREGYVAEQAKIPYKIAREGYRRPDGTPADVPNLSIFQKGGADPPLGKLFKYLSHIDCQGSPNVYWSDDGKSFYAKNSPKVMTRGWRESLLHLLLLCGHADAPYSQHVGMSPPRPSCELAW